MYSNKDIKYFQSRILDLLSYNETSITKQTLDSIIISVFSDSNNSKDIRVNAHVDQIYGDMAILNFTDKEFLEKKVEHYIYGDGISTTRILVENELICVSLFESDKFTIRTIDTKEIERNCANVLETSLKSFGEVINKEKSYMEYKHLVKEDCTDILIVKKVYSTYNEKNELLFSDESLDITIVSNIPSDIPF